MGKVFRLVIGAVKVFVDFNRDFHGQGLSVIIDDNFHLPFLRSEFFEKNLNGAGGERHRG